MANMKNNFAWSSAGALIALSALSGCAHEKTAQMERVDDSSMTRLNEEQMQPVDDARIEEGRACDPPPYTQDNANVAHPPLQVGSYGNALAPGPQRECNGQTGLMVNPEET